MHMYLKNSYAILKVGEGLHDVLIEDLDEFFSSLQQTLRPAAVADARPPWSCPAGFSPEGAQRPWQSIWSHQSKGRGPVHADVYVCVDIIIHEVICDD